MHRWLATARVIVATATLTSAAWLIGGSLWVEQERQRWAAEDERPTAFLPQKTVAFRGSGPSTRAASPGRLVIPVAGIASTELADTFKQARAGGARVHDAIDIMAPRGTPVLAAAAGTVEKVFNSEEGGKTVYVRSADRKLIYYYAHLDAYAPGLAEGQNVAPGQVLGTVGVTGNADPAAPHLHFAVMRTSPEAPWYKQSVPLNPYPLLQGR